MSEQSDYGEFLASQSPDLCDDPINAGTQYCVGREPGETVAEFNARRLAERGAAPKGALAVTVTDGVRRAVDSVPGWAWAALGVLAAFTIADALRGRR